MRVHDANLDGLGLGFGRGVCVCDQTCRPETQRVGTLSIYDTEGGKPGTRGGAL
jgi:hypothetical protein